MTPPAGRRGAIVWAISAFEVEAPFRVVEHDGTEARHADARGLARKVAARELAGEFALVVPAKLRPVLLLQDRPTGRFQDYAALRLTRLEKFDAADQRLVRDGDEDSLFYLGRDKRKYGMDKEYAVLLTSLHRVHRSAIATQPVGAVDRAEYRVICERLARVSDLDLANLITRQAAALVERLRRRS